MKFSTGATFTVNEPRSEESGAVAIANVLRDWVMVLLTVVFVVLYGLALAGKLKPLPDQSIVSHLEPVLFVVLGYYFGRLPAQQSEQTLRSEIKDLTKRAEAARQGREVALQSHEALQERVRSARKALASGSHSSEKSAETANYAGTNTNQHGSVVAALSILSSKD
jgi:hypothetical protein